MNPTNPTDAARVPARTMVTGATGLLGGNVVRALLAGGASEVVALVRDVERARRLLPADGRVRVVAGDIGDVADIRPAMAGLDAIIHTAAYFREYYQPAPDIGLLYRTNVDAVHELLHAAADAGVPTFVHTSSTGTLGPGPGGAPADEDTPPAPDVGRSDYRGSKVASEAVVRTFGADRGVRVPIVLPGWMWGPGDAAPTSAGRLFLAVANGQLRAVPRASNHVVDARDVADAAVRAAVDGQALRRYIVAGRRLTLPEITDAIATATGAGAPRSVPMALATMAATVMEVEARIRGGEPVASRKGLDVLRTTGYPISSARAERELGVRCRPFAQTLADMADWYRAEGMLGAVPVDQGA